MARKYYLELKLFFTRSSVIVICLVLLRPTFVQASQCENLFVVTFGYVPTFLSSLPLDFLTVMKSHPIYKLKEKFKGADITFFVDHYSADGQITEANRDFLGETNQADFTVKVLSFIFPHANFPDRKNIFEEIRVRGAPRVFIADSAALGNGQQINKTHLNMPVIKPANPLTSEHENGRLRKILNLSENQKLISVYGSLPYNMKEGIAGLHLSDSIFSDIPNSSVVVISMAGGREGWGWHDIPSRKGGRSMLFLSEVLSGKKELRFPMVILNDTRGQMPLVLGSADLAVSFGPINFFEPLLRKIPTVVVHYDPFTSFNSETLANLMERGLRTGGLLAGVDQRTKEVVKLISLADRIERSSILPPYLTRDNFGKTEVEHYLDNLYEIIQFQLRKLKKNSVKISSASHQAQ